MNNTLDFKLTLIIYLIICHIVISIADILIIIKIYRNKRRKINILKYYSMVKDHYADEVLLYSFLSLLPIINFIIFIVLIIKKTYIYFKEIVEKNLFRK